MKQHTLQWLYRLGPRTLRGGVLALTAVVALALPVVAAVLHARRGPDGVYAAAVAAGLCWLATVTALVVTKIATDRQARLAGVFGAMLLRTGVPLAEAMNVLIAQTRGSAQTVLQDVREQVSAGVPLAQALTRHPDWFDALFVSAVRVGQASRMVISHLP